MKTGNRGTKGLGDILKGLGEFVEKLSDVEAQVEEKLSRGEDGSTSSQGEWKSRDGRVRGIYGVNVKVGLGGKNLEFEPFGHVRRASAGAAGKDAGKDAVVEELREPLVDVFEEPGRILIVAEMPGVAAADVKLSLEGDLLTITACRADRRYQKEMQLPALIDPAKAITTANNGVVEIVCPL